MDDWSDRPRQEVERSTDLTLEKLAYEVIQAAHRSIRMFNVHSNVNLDTGASRIEAITVRYRNFADALGVEMAIIERARARGKRVGCLVR
jgi:glycine cleavage system regulatory protein